MSQFTDYAENKLADFMRGQTLTLPTDWHFALGSAAADGSFTEVTGTSYARVAVTRSLANFAGTQGVGTTTISSGTSHQTSNNNSITWPAAGSGGWTTATHLGVFDAASGGNCWFWVALPAPQAIGATDVVSYSPGSVTFTVSLSGGVSDYLANKLIDLLWRAQAYSWPANVYVALATTTPTNAAAGTEVTGGAYARVALASSLSAISGTQGAGTTAASSGTGGRISNNAAITFPAPTANWGTVTHVEVFDASSGGNFMFWRALVAAKTVNNGATAPRFDANTLGFTLA